MHPVRARALQYAKLLSLLKPDPIPLPDLDEFELRSRSSEEVRRDAFEEFDDLARGPGGQSRLKQREQQLRDRLEEIGSLRKQAGEQIEDISTALVQGLYPEHKQRLESRSSELSKYVSNLQLLTIDLAWRLDALKTCRFQYETGLIPKKPAQVSARSGRGRRRSEILTYKENAQQLLSEPGSFDKYKDNSHHVQKHIEPFFWEDLAGASGKSRDMWQSVRRHVTGDMKGDFGPPYTLERLKAWSEAAARGKK